MFPKLYTPGSGFVVGVRVKGLREGVSLIPQLLLTVFSSNITSRTVLICTETTETKFI